jgi:predicted Zn-dependent protease with MMP-like domain
MPRDWNSAAAPTLDDFAALAEDAYRTLPQPFRRLAGEVRMVVEDFADDEVLDGLGIENPFELTGIYEGVNLADRSVLDPIPNLSQVRLFRRPILDEWAERGDVTLGELIAHVLVHEIGHHFGLSDADIHEIEDQT